MMIRIAEKTSMSCRNLRRITALYISGDRSHTPEGTEEKKFLSDYQKKNPPVK
jgi:hypothetical protein